MVFFEVARSRVAINPGTRTNCCIFVESRWRKQCIESKSFFTFLSSLRWTLVEEQNCRRLCGYPAMTARWKTQNERLHYVSIQYILLIFRQKILDILRIRSRKTIFHRSDRAFPFSLFRLLPCYRTEKSYWTKPLFSEVVKVRLLSISRMSAKDSPATIAVFSRRLTFTLLTHWKISASRFPAKRWKELSKKTERNYSNQYQYILQQMAE